MTTNLVSSLTQKLTFEAYRFYHDDTDTRYELERGYLLPMPIATGLHSRIWHFLVHLLRCYITEHQLNLVAVSDLGVRTGLDTSRIPDAVVCSPSLWQKVCARSGAGILDFEETPNLVIEVTSENWRTDYILKRAEYALRNIPEYWVIDPNKQKILLFTNPEQDLGYEKQELSLGQELRSWHFPDFVCSVEKILFPPTVEELMAIEQNRVQQLQERADQLAALLRQQGINPDKL